MARRSDRPGSGAIDALIDQRGADDQPGRRPPAPRDADATDQPTHPDGTARPALATVATLTMLLFGAAVLLIGGNEFRKRGAGSIGGLSPVDRAAQAEVAGGTVPDFELPSLVGPGTIALQPLRGHVVVVNFWASWCGPCRTEAPDLQRSWRRYSSDGVRFVGVDERDNQASAASFVAEFDIGYPSAYDPSGTLADDFRLQGLPTTFVVDPQGEIRYRFIGILDRRTLGAAIDDILAPPRSNGT